MKSTPQQCEQAPIAAIARRQTAAAEAEAFSSKMSEFSSLPAADTAATPSA